MRWQSEVLAAARIGARQLRIGLEAQASDAIVTIVDALAHVPADELGSLDAIFGEIATAQRRRDLLRLADLLEYDLPPALAGPAA